MKICMFSRIMPTHSPGGMQDHVQALSAGLVRKGHAVTVITSGRSDGMDREVIDGVEIHFIKGTAVGRYSSRYWSAAADRFQQLQPTENFQMVHSQSVGAYGIYKRGLCDRYHLPLITTLHGTHSDVLTTSWHTDVALTNPRGTARFGALTLDLLFRYLYRDLRFIRASDVVIATSDADVGKYKRLYRLSEDRIRKVYNGIDTELFRPESGSASVLRRRLGIADGTKIVLALARLEKDKGVQNAISVLPRLLKNELVQLVVVGDGDYRSALEVQARALQVQDHVCFVGAQPLAECAAYFNLCDVFVDPTLRTDGYDLTIAEAMACGKPVIVSDVGANSTLIDAVSQKDGILIPRGDNDALAREVLRVLGDAPLAAELGAEARAKIAARFSITAMVQGMERVYAEAAALKKGSAGSRLN